MVPLILGNPHLMGGSISWILPEVRAGPSASGAPPDVEAKEERRCGDAFCFVSVGG